VGYYYLFFISNFLLLINVIAGAVQVSSEAAGFFYILYANCIYVNFLLCIKLNPAGDLAYASRQIRVSNINEIY
jgi:hypothetical protein